MFGWMIALLMPAAALPAYQEALVVAPGEVIVFSTSLPFSVPWPYTVDPELRAMTSVPGAPRSRLRVSAWWTGDVAVEPLARGVRLTLPKETLRPRVLWLGYEDLKGTRFSVPLLLRDPSPGGAKYKEAKRSVRMPVPAVGGKSVLLRSRSTQKALSSYRVAFLPNSIPLYRSLEPQLGTKALDTAEPHEPAPLLPASPKPGQLYHSGNDGNSPGATLALTNTQWHGKLERVRAAPGRKTYSAGGVEIDIRGDETRDDWSFVNAVTQSPIFDDVYRYDPRKGWVFVGTRRASSFQVVTQLMAWSEGEPQTETYRRRYPASLDWVWLRKNPYAW